MLWVQVEGSGSPRSGILQNGGDPKAAGPCTRADEGRALSSRGYAEGKATPKQPLCLDSSQGTAFCLCNSNLLANISSQLQQCSHGEHSRARSPLLCSHSYFGPEAIAFGSGTSVLPRPLVCFKNTSKPSCPHSSQSPPQDGTA